VRGSSSARIPLGAPWIATSMDAECAEDLIEALALLCVRRPDLPTRISSEDLVQIAAESFGHADAVVSGAALEQCHVTIWDAYREELVLPIVGRAAAGHAPSSVLQKQRAPTKQMCRQRTRLAAWPDATAMRRQKSCASAADLSNTFFDSRPLRQQCPASPCATSAKRGLRADGVCRDVAPVGSRAAASRSAPVQGRAIIAVGRDPKGDRI
jgi:hypothetical protein